MWKDIFDTESLDNINRKHETNIDSMYLGVQVELILK